MHRSLIQYVNNSLSDFRYTTLPCYSTIIKLQSETPRTKRYRLNTERLLLPIKILKYKIEVLLLFHLFPPLWLDGREAPWAGRQSTAGPTLCDTQPLTLTFTPMSKTTGSNRLAHWGLSVRVCSIINESTNNSFDCMRQNETKSVCSISKHIIPERVNEHCRPQRLTKLKYF